MSEDLIREFLIESHENLDQLDRDLIALESTPQDRPRLGSVFRTIHTIKGTCGFFGFAKLESVSHVGENLLSLLREGALVLNPLITTALLQLVDAIREMLGQIESGGAEGNGNYDALIEQLTQLQAVGADAHWLAGRASDGIDGPRDALAADADAPELPLSAPAVPSSPTGAAVPPSAFSDAYAEPISSPDSDQAASSIKSTAAGSGISLAESSIRVDVGLLDKLMTLVGELVLARNQIMQFNATQKDSAFLNTTQRLNLITSELQEGVMKTRMQPIGTLWDRLPRVVRDLSLACGKSIRVEMAGKEIELDKTLIEAIKDPLTHVVRNAVDHGIETPQRRREGGKPAEGCLRLHAFHEGGQVIIDISDDGAGINPDKVKRKALERGLITPEQAGRMSDRELINLVFLPGFSMADKITNVSGRGVGMDVVKTNIGKINGSVDLQSKLGQGTTLRIKIPLTLAIIPALMVVSGGERYAIPQVSLVELVRLDREQAGGGLESVHGAPVCRLSGRLLPLVFLEDILQSANQGRSREALNLVVLQAEHRQFGLVVDGIHDTEEIVVKPLSRQLKDVPIYAGATIMGDGRVALIMDVLGIAQLAGLVVERQRQVVEEPLSPEAQADRHACLLVQAGKERRLAIPLALVARLEEVSPRDIERADEQQVLQYRGRILPLVHVGSHLFGELPDSARETLPLVVCCENDRSVGLLVERIVDIVKTPLDRRCLAKRSGLLGSAVINDQVTGLMDVAGILETLSI